MWKISEYWFLAGKCEKRLIKGGKGIYEKSEVQAVLTSSDTKLFLAQDKSEIQYIKEVFKLSEGEAAFLTTCARGQGLFKVGEQTAIIEIRPTKKEFEFIETNVNKLKERQS